MAVWNGRSNHLFRSSEFNPTSVVHHTSKFGEEFSKADNILYLVLDADDILCKKPSPGFWKTNFDAANLVIRVCDGVVCVVVLQEIGFCGPKVKEAMACTFAVRKAMEPLFMKMVVEGDCLSIYINIYKIE